VVHSRDVEDCAGALRRKSTLKLVNFSYIMVLQYWFGNSKPKKSFQIDPKRFQKVSTEFKKNYLTEFSTACLPACLIFLLFTQRGVIRHTVVHTMRSSWT